MWNLMFILWLTGSVTCLVYECSEDRKCEIEGTNCMDNVCQCPDGFVYSSDMTRCMQELSVYGAECEETVQCQFLLSGATCTDSTCQCQPGYVYLRGRCTKVSGIREKCSTDLGCHGSHDLEALTCVEEACQCSEGYYERGNGECRRKGEKVGDHCVLDVDCIFANSVCKSMVCESTTEDNTVEKQLINKKKSTEINMEKSNGNNMLGEGCINDEECNKDVQYSYCNYRKKCDCKPGYFKDEDLCYAELGQEASAEELCDKIKNYEYRNGKCMCKLGYFYADNMIECVKPTQQYSFSCTSDLNCFTFGASAVCPNKQCVCNETSHYAEEDMYCWKTKGLEEPCTSDNECLWGDQPLVCTLNKCACAEGSKPDLEAEICVKSNAVLGDKCGKDLDCAVVNSKCDKTCICQHGFSQIENKCVLDLGGPCEASSDCISYDNGACVEGECGCTDDFIANGTDGCLPIAEDFGDDCQMDMQCWSNVGKWSACVNEACACTDSAHYRDEACWPKRFLGESCSRISECYASRNLHRVLCKNGFCECDYGFAVNNDKTQCIGDEFSGSSYGYQSMPVLTLLSVQFVTYFSLRLC